MNILILIFCLLFLAPVSAPAASAPAPDSTQTTCGREIAACRKLRPDAGAILAETERAPAVLARVPTTRYLEMYRTCRAVAAGDPAECDALTRVSGSKRPGGLGEPMAQHCRDSVEQALVIRAFERRDPDAAALCAAHRLEAGFRPGAQQTICGLLLAEKPDVAHFQEALRPLFVNPPSEQELAQVANTYLVLLGDESSCNAMGPNDDTYETCVDVSAYHVARPTGKPSLCGPGHGLCRVMMGEKVDACGVYLELLRDMVYCPLSADRKVAAALKSASAPVSPAASCLGEAYAAAWAVHEFPDSERFRSFRDMSMPTPFPCAAVGASSSTPAGLIPPATGSMPAPASKK